jgi:hypothetical protein
METGTLLRCTHCCKPILTVACSRSRTPFTWAVDLNRLTLVRPPTTEQVSKLIEFATLILLWGAWRYQNKKQKTLEGMTPPRENAFPKKHKLELQRCVQFQRELRESSGSDVRHRGTDRRQQRLKVDHAPCYWASGVPPLAYPQQRRS